MDARRDAGSVFAGHKNSNKALCVSCACAYRTHINSKDIIERLEQHGWVFQNMKGSHHVYRHPTLPGHISIPHQKKDLGVGLVAKLFKQGGLK